MMISEPPDGDYVAAFKERFTREYGFDLVDRDLRIDDVRVRGIGAAELLRRVPMDGGGDAETTAPPEPDSVARVYFDDGWRDTPIFLIETLRPRGVVRGPAVISKLQLAGMELVPASETSCMRNPFCCSMRANFE